VHPVQAGVQSDLFSTSRFLDFDDVQRRRSSDTTRIPFVVPTSASALGMGADGVQRHITAAVAEIWPGTLVSISYDLAHDLGFQFCTV
jgi:hypothetical protein